MKYIVVLLALLSFGSLAACEPGPGGGTVISGGGSDGGGGGGC